MLLLVLCGGMTLPVIPARAQDARPKLTETQKQEVRDRYERATRFYYLRKYPEAVAEYEAIYLLSADPVMLYNIAQCHRQADQPEKAAQFYRNYLRNAPTASNRADVDKKIAEMDQLVEERRLGAATPGTTPGPASPGTGVSQPVAPPGSAPAPPAAAPPAIGAPPPYQDVPTGPTASSPPPATWSPPPTGMPSPQVSPTVDLSQPEDPAAGGSHVLRWSLLVGGGVFLTTSIVAGAVAASKAKDIDAAAKTRMRAFTTDLKATEDAGRAANNLAVGTAVIGLAALGAGLYIWKSESDEPAAQARSFVIPVAGPGYAGALAKVGF